VKTVSEEKIVLEINQSRTRMVCGGHVEIDVVLKKNSPGNENTRFYLTKTKHESNLLSYLCWLTHPGLKVSALTFKSRDQYIRETDARNRASVLLLQFSYSA
jgi:hypothetical protein